VQRLNYAFLTGVFIGMLSVSGWGQNASPSAAIEPKADEILKQMGKCLAETARFSVKAEKMIDYVLETGQKIQLTNATSVVVDRPGKLWAKTTGDTGTEQAWYSGTSLTLLNEDKKSYAQLEVPDTIDKMMDFLVQQYGWSMPLADLIFSDPYKSATEKVRMGQYIGLHFVEGIPCHHLAFRQEGLDWQIWIDAGEKALPRKLVITDKESPGYPQFIAILKDWNLSPTVSGDRFIPNLPEGATRMDAQSLRGPAEQTPEHKK